MSATTPHCRELHPRRRRYSRMMGEDEAGTVWTVREHLEAARPVKHRCNARERPLPSRAVDQARCLNVRFGVAATIG
jgi:hypothetical protein